MTHTALLLGSSGAIGSRLLPLLLASPRYERVTVVVRRAPNFTHPRLHVVTVDFEQLDTVAGSFAVDDVYCCLGTTIRTAGSRAAFERVDHHYIVHSARLARAAGANQFLLVSAVGADPRASAFYSRVKGRTEADVTAIDFPTLHIVRPSLLLGEREERRSGEEWAKRFAPAFGTLCFGPLAKYRPVHVQDVAARMVTLATQTSAPQGRLVHYFE